MQDGLQAYREKIPNNYPKEDSKEYQELEKFSSEVELILLTINDHEYHAAAIHMEKPPGGFNRAVFVPGNGNRVVGVFGGMKTVLIQSRVGSDCDTYIQQAIDTFPKAQFVIAVGVCYAFDRSKYQCGDVLVSKQICNLLNSKFEDGKILNRGTIVDVADKLTRFCMDLGVFNFEVTDKRQCKVYSGRLASLPFLVNDKDKKEAIRACVTELIGGEMEGCTLLKFHKNYPKKGVIIIKGVVDYADGSKSKEWQFTSAKAAVCYTLFKLERAPLNPLSKVSSYIIYSRFVALQ